MKSGEMTKICDVRKGKVDILYNFPCCIFEILCYYKSTKR